MTLATTFPLVIDTPASLGKALNRKESRLNGLINSSQTTITLISTSGFPDHDGYIVIDDEQIEYTGVTGNDLTGCTRGFGGTSAAEHKNNRRVFYDYAAEFHEAVRGAIIALETKMGAGAGLQDLQAVTTNGATTTNPITINTGVGGTDLTLNTTATGLGANMALKAFNGTEAHWELNALADGSLNIKDFLDGGSGTNRICVAGNQVATEIGLGTASVSGTTVSVGGSLNVTGDTLLGAAGVGSATLHVKRAAGGTELILESTTAGIGANMFFKGQSGVQANYEIGTNSGGKLIVSDFLGTGPDRERWTIEPEVGGVARVGVGTTSTARVYFQLDSMTTAERDAGTPEIGDQLLNTTVDDLQFRTAAAWHGVLRFDVVSKVANYTATTDDRVILCDATAGSFTIDLPATSGKVGLYYYIKKIATDVSANAITIDGDGTETIDDALTIALNLSGDSVTLASDGSNWHVL